MNCIWPNMKYILASLTLLMSTMLLAGCANSNRHILGANDESQLQVRSIQTRAFDTSDKNMVVRNVVASLQDLNFVIDKADADLGTVTATKLSGYQIRMTVTVRPKGDTQMVVRANGQYNNKVILDPVMYQDFFAVLQKSLFLTANSID
ncbi:MAG: hypothetical protein KAY78_04235 [Pseudomonadales bacterium]|jgi:hypothetical protein|nr:hypothetical protein [Pseudomonadales bacterium]